MHVIDRRRMLQSVGLGAAGVSFSGWLPQLAARAAGSPERRRACIVLWMSGGPSQTDTFDMKPDHENGGEFKEIATAAPGVRFSEHLPQLAQHADRLAVIRSLSTKEGDHERGAYLMHTGQRPMGPVDYPAVGAGLAKELASPDSALPPYVCVAPGQTFSSNPLSPGFLGPRYSPLVVRGSGSGAHAHGEGFASLAVNSIHPPAGVTPEQIEHRLEFWQQLQSGFLQNHPQAAARAQHTVYENALRMIQSDAAAAFDLDQEPKALREQYGRGEFGQGCLLARRLVERGVAFVEVALNSAAGTGTIGWDTHSDNFNAVAALSAELDAGWSTLMTDLAQRGLLETTTIMWIGEFGRTPQINGAAGRDHFPQAWSCVLGGGGIAGGQAYGRTSVDGTHIEENPVNIDRVLATVATAVGVNPYTENEATSGRPIKLVDADPIDELLA